MLDEPALSTATQPVMARCLSGDDIGAAVDIDGAAGDALGERRCQVGAGIAHVHDVDEFAQWRLLRRLVQQQLEILEARGRARLERAGRDGVHADAARPQLEGEVAAGGFEGGLDRPHDVVVRHHAVGAVVAHGEHRAAVGHQRRREPGHADKGMAGNVHRLGEALGRAVEQAAAQVLERGEGDRMDQDVELAPAPADLVEHCLELARHGNVQRSGDGGLQRARQRLDMGARLVVQPGDGEIGADGAERLGAAIGDRLVVGDADHQRLAASQDRAEVLVHVRPQGMAAAALARRAAATSTATAQEASRVSSESARLVRMMGTRAPSTIPAASAPARKDRLLASMLPASRSGTISTLARPATGETMCLMAAASRLMALSSASGPSSTAPVICPRSAILQSAAASTVDGTLGLTCSMALRMATRTPTTPMAWARSIAFCTISTLSSSVGAMFTAASLMISASGWLGTSITKQWLMRRAVRMPVSRATTAPISSSV